MLKLKMSNAKETNVAELKHNLEGLKSTLKGVEKGNNVYEQPGKIKTAIKNLEKRIEEYDDPAPGAPKGGKTRKHRKGSKKTMKKSKRRHRK